MAVSWLPFSNVTFESSNVIYIFNELGNLSETFTAIYLRELIRKCLEFTVVLIESI